MQRIPSVPRPQLEETALAHGYEYHSGIGVPYWDETAYYRFTLKQIEEDIEDAANEIEAMCYELLERAVSDEAIYQRIAIPETHWDYISESWRTREKDLYGRMDFSYDGTGKPKLLEYNADTPTTLYEAAIFQWVWLEQAVAAKLVPHGCDQFAEIHEDLVAAFAAMGMEGILHFACLSDIEDDRETVIYLEECATEAGLETHFLAIKDIGIDTQAQFTDLDDQVISTMFKLYPWEWILAEPFGKYLAASGVCFLEPPWKAVLSNKGLLPYLWEMFEGHPNLLPAYFEGDPDAANLPDDYVRKPLYSRRSANIQIIRNEAALPANDGPYGEEGFIVQGFHPLPTFAGRHPVVGCWMVAGRPAGLSIRESRTLITDEAANFVPHVILD